jgi:translation initiation factor 5A
MSRPVDAGSLKVGQLIVIENEPCKIVEVEKSKPGKHGSAKVRIVGMGIFDNVKRSMVSPADSKVETPLLEKRSGQVVAITPTSIQIMDLETYDTLWTEVPEEEVRSKLAIGLEIEYWKALDKLKIIKVKE